MKKKQLEDALLRAFRHGTKEDIDNVIRTIEEANLCWIAWYDRFCGGVLHPNAFWANNEDYIYNWRCKDSPSCVVVDTYDNIYLN